MNKIQYDQTGGFPLTTNRLTNMQEAFAPLINGLGIMAGNQAIISGCHESGSMISDGIVQVGNEIFQFKKGIKQTYVTVFEEKIEAEFENGQIKEVVIKRYVSFGTGTQNYKWEEFKRIPPLNELIEFMNETREAIKILKAQNSPITQGDGIVFFNNIATLIPPGYVELPESEWRGRIPVHINRSDPALNAVGKTVGNLNRTVIIKKENLPSNAGTIPAPTFSGNKYKRQGDGNSSIAADQRGNINIMLGNDVPLDISDPLRVVIFIKWVGLGKGLNG